jgi:microcystin-dependent protein
MYEKRNWKARKGTGLNKFTESEKSGNTVVLTNTPDSISEPGTPFTPENMNHIEQGVADAHDAVAAEAQTREKADNKEVTERNSAIIAHDTNNGAHADIRTIIEDESQNRQRADEYLQGQIDNEMLNRQQGDIDALNAAKNYADQTATELSAILDGAQVITLSGALLTRVINGTTPVAINLFDPSTAFTADKTIIGDSNGTIGVYRYNIDSATVIVETLSVSPMSANEPTLLGNVSSHAGLPLTVEDATAKGWNTPRLDDYAQVLNDETFDNQRVEWYISAIDASGNITWGNPVIINAGDYQAQTTAADTGKVLTGGLAAGTFGTSLAVDSEPTENSANLVRSHGVFVFVNRLIQQVLNAVFLLAHPVGCIYLTANANENTAAAMNAKYGGTWAAWGQGRVPVGVNSSGTFNTLEKTGGAETHTLTKAEIPGHEHAQIGTFTSVSESAGHDHAFTGNAHAHDLYSSSGATKGGNDAITSEKWNGGTNIELFIPSNSKKPVQNTTASGTIGTNRSTHTHNTTLSGNTGTIGSGNAHNIVQPYITCYMYKRVS